MNDTVRRILATARGELGTTEWPAGSNRVKYNTWYYRHVVTGDAYPWCVTFVQWVYDRADAALPFRTASCTALLDWYRRNDPHRIVDDPQPGDVVIYRFSSSSYHMGIVDEVNTSAVSSIDGNTGYGNEANGGAVMRRTRGRSLVAAFIRPASNEEPDEAEEEEQMATRYNAIDEMPAWAQASIRRIVDKGLIGGGGEKKDADGRPADLDLSLDMIRLLVIMERAF